MRKHLRVVLALFLNVDNENLLDPEAPLYKVVPLENAIDLTERPAFPDAVQVEPEVRVIHDVLPFVSQYVAIGADREINVPCPTTMIWCSRQSAMLAP